MNEKGELLKIIALLLDYPGRELVDDLDELDEAIRGVSEETVNEKCREFVAHLRSTPLSLLQEDYAATFDLTPETCLNLSYHKVGDGKQRGPALLVFREAYKSMRYEPASEELPDYLPMVLEFLSLCPEEARRTILREYSGEIEKLSGRLHGRKSPYSGLFQVLSSLCRNCG